jgi:hypothetical protein
MTASLGSAPRVTCVSAPPPGAPPHPWPPLTSDPHNMASTDITRPRGGRGRLPA